MTLIQKRKVLALHGIPVIIKNNRLYADSTLDGTYIDDVTDLTRSEFYILLGY